MAGGGDGGMRLVEGPGAAITANPRTRMTDLLHPELLDVDGRVYRVLGNAAASGSGRRPGPHPQQQRQRHYETEDDAGDDDGSWGGGGEPAGSGGADEEEASVPIRQEGDSFVARMCLDSEVRDGMGKLMPGQDAVSSRPPRRQSPPNSLHRRATAVLP